MRKVGLRRESGVSSIETCIVIPLLILAIIASIGAANFFYVWSKLNSMTAMAAVTFRSTMSSSELTDHTKVPSYAQLVHNPAGDEGLKAKQLAWYTKKKNTGFALNAKGELEPKSARFLNDVLGIFMVVNPDIVFPPAVQTAGLKVQTIWDGGAYEIKLDALPSIIGPEMVVTSFGAEDSSTLTMSSKSTIFEKALKLFSSNSKEPIISSSAVLRGVADSTLADLSGITAPFLGFETKAGLVVPGQETTAGFGGAGSGGGGSGTGGAGGGSFKK